MGEITQISVKNVSVSVGNIISKMAIDKVERISNQQYKESVRSNRTTPVGYDTTSISMRRLDFKPQIDIRGERLNDAMDIVTGFIDDAIMVGMGEVSILHGKGNGVLRQEIQKYLRTVPGVASVHDESIEHGGTGVTIVKLDY